ncbi:TetR/AcrR family transcriptional regulator [Mesorhizobium sp. Cs1299R1N3]|uniref:TetR/AcrR family transcriptional regulator n=1 Tax=Mesorhizobium sp. Cs1299R1N3 TaxID=3015173 RepID=UPI00301CBD0D
MTGETYQDRVKEEKRVASVAAATKLFFEQGYGATSLQQIAKLADVSTATLFKRYPTKASLFEAIVEEFWTLESGCHADVLVGDPNASLRKIGRDYADRMRQPRMVAIFRLIIAEALRFPDLGQMLFDRGFEPYLDRLSAYVIEEAQAGNLVVPDAKLAAQAFLATIAGQAFWPELMAPGCGGTDKDLSVIIDEAVATFLARYGAKLA